jgi:hypothetical protein
MLTVNDASAAADDGNMRPCGEVWHRPLGMIQFLSMKSTIATIAAATSAGKKNDVLVAGDFPSDCGFSRVRALASVLRV